METSSLPRHRIIKSLTAQLPEKQADAVISLWEQMASQIISLIGDSGFSSLYARSLFLTQSTFPWLAADSAPPQTGHRFAQLKTSLEGRNPLQASEANNLLLITFTDILASLIGESLTTRILRSAWGNDALDRTGEEFNNE